MTRRREAEASREEAERRLEAKEHEVLVLQNSLEAVNERVHQLQEESIQQVKETEEQACSIRKQVDVLSAEYSSKVRFLEDESREREVSWQNTVLWERQRCDRLEAEKDTCTRLLRTQQAELSAMREELQECQQGLVAYGQYIQYELEAAASTAAADAAAAGRWATSHELEKLRSSLLVHQRELAEVRECAQHVQPLQQALAAAEGELAILRECMSQARLLSSRLSTSRSLDV